MTAGGYIIFFIFFFLIGYGCASHTESKEARSLYHQLQNQYRKIESLQRRLYEATGRRT